MLTLQHRFTTNQSMRMNLWRSRKDILIFCLLFVKVRTEEFENSSVFVWTGIFFCTDKNRCVFKNIRIRVDGASAINVQMISLTCENLYSLYCPVRGMLS